MQTPSQRGKILSAPRALYQPPCTESPAFAAGTSPHMDLATTLSAVAAASATTSFVVDVASVTTWSAVDAASATTSSAVDAASVRPEGGGRKGAGPVATQSMDGNAAAARAPLLPRARRGDGHGDPRVSCARMRGLSPHRAGCAGPSPPPFPRPTRERDGADASRARLRPPRTPPTPPTRAGRVVFFACDLGHVPGSTSAERREELEL